LRQALAASGLSCGLVGDARNLIVSDLEACVAATIGTSEVLSNVVAWRPRSDTATVVNAVLAVEIEQLRISQRSTGVRRATVRGGAALLL